MKEWEPYRFACPDCRERLRRDKEKWFICPRCKRIYEVGTNAQLAAEAKIFSHAFRKIAMNVYALSLRKIAVPQKIAVRDCAVALLSQANEERTENSFCSRLRVEKDGTAWQEKNAASETNGRLRAVVRAGDIRKQSGLSDRYAVYVDAYTDDCSIRAVTESADVYYAKGTALYEEKQYSAAVAQFRSAAAVEHVGAQYMMGVCSEKGRGVMQNYPEAVRWYNLAAEQGNPDAQRRLGVCYEEGRGVARDARKATEWYRKAAERGDPDAQCLLGYAIRRDAAFRATTTLRYPGCASPRQKTAFRGRRVWAFFTSAAWVWRKTITRQCAGTVVPPTEAVRTLAAD